MHALASSPHYDQIMHQIANLSTEEQLRLIGKISSTLRKRIPLAASRPSTQANVVAAIKGKYAFIPTSSDLFAQRKAEEIESER